VCVCARKRSRKKERKGKKELTKSNQFSDASPSYLLPVRPSPPPLTPQKSIPLKTSLFIPSPPLSNPEELKSCNVSGKTRK